VPDLIFTGDRFESGLALVCDQSGTIRLTPSQEVQNAIRLQNRAILPGLINAHSHAFQRVIRARSEDRSKTQEDTFWGWREMMYSAATRLTEEDIYDASRMAFLEMALAGITAVGEFHYIHNAPDGTPYDDPNLLGKAVVRAARDVGLRIALINVAYARAGYETEANPQQLRFLIKDPETYLKQSEQLGSDLQGIEGAWLGVAPHSIRALPLAYLKEVIRFGNEQRIPIHMHVAEQPAEVSACIEEYRRSPVALLETEGLLNDRLTVVHAIHITPKAAWMLGQSRTKVCACPTTERNLADGVVPVDEFFKQQISVCLGTDSQIQIDLLEDARELEYHLRLSQMRRSILAGPEDAGPSSLARRLFKCATENGAASIGAPGGSLSPHRPVDFFTVDLNDPCIAGARVDDLLSHIVFSLSQAAIKDVVVGGKPIVENGRHAEQEQIVERFGALQQKLWG